VDLKAALDQELLSWDGVEERKMMGCPSYLVGRKMFALVVTGGVVITKLDDTQKEALSNVHQWELFNAHRTIKKWAHPQLKSSSVETSLPFVKMSYERAKETANT